jgi:hypothetical protein
VCLVDHGGYPVKTHCLHLHDVLGGILRRDDSLVQIDDVENGGGYGQ